MNYGDNYYNLIKIDLRNDTPKLLIPFDKRYYEEDLGWGMSGQVGQYCDTTLVAFSRNDTIYNVSGNKAYAQYIVDFTQNKIPENLSSVKGSEVFVTASEEGYNSGISEVVNSRNYIICDFTEWPTSYAFFTTRTAKKSLSQSRLY